MSMEKKAKVIRQTDVEPYVPPKHSESDAWSLVNKNTCGCDSVIFAITEIRPGGRSDKDVHPKSDHVYYVLSGRGKAVVEGETFDLEPGVAFYIPAGAEHEIDVVGRETLRFVVLFAPPPQ